MNNVQEILSGSCKHSQYITRFNPIEAVIRVVVISVCLITQVVVEVSTEVELTEIVLI